MSLTKDSEGRIYRNGQLLVEYDKYKMMTYMALDPLYGTDIIPKNQKSTDFAGQEDSDEKSRKKEPDYGWRPLRTGWMKMWFRALPIGIIVGIGVGVGKLFANYLLALAGLAVYPIEMRRKRMAYPRLYQYFLYAWYKAKKLSPFKAWANTLIRAEELGFRSRYKTDEKSIKEKMILKTEWKELQLDRVRYLAKYGANARISGMKPVSHDTAPLYKRFLYKFILLDNYLRNSYLNSDFLKIVKEYRVDKGYYEGLRRLPYLKILARYVYTKLYKVSPFFVISIKYLSRHLKIGFRNIPWAIAFITSYFWVFRQIPKLLQVAGFERGAKYFDEHKGFFLAYSGLLAFYHYQWFIGYRNWPPYPRIPYRQRPYAFAGFFMVATACDIGFRMFNRRGTNEELRDRYSFLSKSEYKDDLMAPRELKGSPVLTPKFWKLFKDNIKEDVRRNLDGLSGDLEIIKQYHIEKANNPDTPAPVFEDEIEPDPESGERKRSHFAETARKAAVIASNFDEVIQLVIEHKLDDRYYDRMHKKLDEKTEFPVKTEKYNVK